MNNKPNILLIIMDPARADHLSCYGYKRKTTPNIDRIAMESVIYKDAISPAPWTVPSHASIFTGLFPSQHGASHQNLYLDKNIPTLGEILHNSGYSTVGFSNNPWVSSATGLDRGFEKFYGVGAKSKIRFHGKRICRKVVKILFLTNDNGAHITNLLVKRWLKKNYNSQKRPQKPFFMFINYLEPHLPYKPPKFYYQQFLNKNPGTKTLRRFNQISLEKYLGKKIKLTKEDFDILKSLYDAELAYLDFRIGELVSYLKSEQVLENTILIITGDHGENIGEHQLLDHQYCLYDTLVRVPLIIRYPELFSPGLDVTSQVQTIDLFPTLEEILGIELKNLNLPGQSLLPSKIGQDPRQFTFAEFEKPTKTLEKLVEKYPDFETSPLDRSLKMIRSKNYKYIESSNGQDELYDLSKDPNEFNNIISSLPQKAKELKAKLNERFTSFAKSDIASDSYEVDENTKKLLKKLGYFT